MRLAVPPPLFHCLLLLSALCPPDTTTAAATAAVVSIRDRLLRAPWQVPLLRRQPRRQDEVTVRARYGDDMVLRFNISSVDDASALADATGLLSLDVWEFAADWADVRVARPVLPSLLGLLPASLRHAHAPLIRDLAGTILESLPPASASSSSSGPSPSRADETDVFFGEYQPLSVILPWMRLVRSLFPAHVSLISIGLSSEGRNIHALRVGLRPAHSGGRRRRRKTVVVSGGSHAREWIGTSTVNHLAHTLITSYGRTGEATRLVEAFDWIFIPTLNPDGYVHTWEADRLWRKNRQPTGPGPCRGVDLDRTFGFRWDGGGGGDGDDPCSESFAGTKPFEGVESLALASWARNETAANGTAVVGFLDLHSYSQQVLYPYSHSCADRPPTLENLEELALGMQKAMHRAGGRAAYAVASACGGGAVGAGSALDWMYHELHVRYAYQIKLRDTGAYGFLLPAKDIVPTGREMFAALSYFGSYLLDDADADVDDALVAAPTETADDCCHDGWELRRRRGRH